MGGQGKMRLFMGLWWLAFGCVQKTSESPRPAISPTQSGQSMDRVTIQGVTAANGSTLDEVVIPVTVPVTYGDAVDRSVWSYTFTYLNVNRSANIPVASNGHGTIRIGALPLNQRGDMTLRLLEDGVAKFQGTAQAVTLTPTNNRVSMQMSVVVPGSSPQPNGPQASVPPPGQQAPPPGPPSQSAPNPLPLPSVGPGELSADFYNQKNIGSIFRTSCGECHSQGQSLDLTSFPFPNRNAKDTLAKIISFTDGSTPVMPPGNRVKLPSDAVNTLKEWLSTTN